MTARLWRHGLILALVAVALGLAPQWRRLLPLGLLLAAFGAHAGLEQAAWAQADAMQVTVTHYADSGVTYSGGRTYVGMAACSWNIPMFATVRFADGREYRCEDRGLLGNSGWIDIFVPDVQTARQLGRYTATVEVTR